MLVDRMIETEVPGDGEMPEEDLNEKRSINVEMEELAKYVEVITKTIREMESPMTSPQINCLKPPHIYMISPK